MEFLVDTKAELFDLTVRWGLQVLGAVLEEDRAALCGPRYAHQPDPAASRAGSVPSEVVPAADLPGAGALGHPPPTTARTETSAFAGERDQPLDAAGAAPESCESTSEPFATLNA